MIFLGWKKTNKIDIVIICTSQEIGATCRKAIQNVEKKWDPRGTSLAIQWSRLHASTTGGPGMIPSRETKILYAVQPKWGKNGILC